LTAWAGTEIEANMQDLGWQDVVALGVVLAAASYLARLAWGAVATKRKSPCGTGCARCSARADVSPSIPEQVVSIGGVASQFRR
jgi:hypothetical protein